MESQSCRSQCPMPITHVCSQNCFNGRKQFLFPQCLENENHYSKIEKSSLSKSELNENYKKLNRKAQSHALLNSLREPSSKYPLECSWSFWFFKNNGGSNWKDNLIELTIVDSVEDFWSVFNYLKPVKELADGRDYMFFKTGIKPMWEDPENIDGGRWLLTIEKKRVDLNDLWQNALLSLVGSQYDKESSLVNGAFFNRRFKVNKLALWTNNSSKIESQNNIGKRFKRALNVDNLIIYEVHQNQIKERYGCQNSELEANCDFNKTKSN